MTGFEIPVANVKVGCSFALQNSQRFAACVPERAAAVDSRSKGISESPPKASASARRNIMSGLTGGTDAGTHISCMHAVRVEALFILEIYPLVFGKFKKPVASIAFRCKLCSILQSGMKTPCDHRAGLCHTRAACAAAGTRPSFTGILRFAIRASSLHLAMCLALRGCQARGGPIQ